MLSRGHCRHILANEKQESIATVSMGKKNISFCSYLIVLDVFALNYSVMSTVSTIKLRTVPYMIHR